MKYIKTFESYNQSEKIDENLKSVIAGALLSLSTLLSNKADAFGGHSSFSHTSHMLNPSNPVSPLRSYGNSDPSESEISREIDKMDIKDAELIKIKISIDDGIQSEQEFHNIVADLKKFANLKGYSNIIPILDEISLIDFDRMKDSKYNEELKNRLEEIIANLDEMKDIFKYDKELNITAVLIVIGIITILLTWLITLIIAANKGEIRLSRYAGNPMKPTSFNLRKRN